MSHLPNLVARFTFIAFILTLSGCGQEVSEPGVRQSADLIFYGSHIITMDDSLEGAAALAVKDGRILAVGSRGDISKLKNEQTQIINLENKALLPGFIDTHGHFASQALVMGMVNVAAPPVGPVDSIAKLKEVLSDELKARNLPKGAWLLGFGYEPSLFKDEVRQPDRDDLDAVSKEHPIYLVHQSGHLGTTNSLALSLTGYDSSTENPEGGVIVRRQGSNEPNGVLEEKANWKVFYSLPKPPVEAVFHLLSKAQDYYAGYGITTTQEGRASDDQVKLLQGYAGAGKLDLDLVVYPDIETGAKSLENWTSFGIYNNRLKLGGVKISLDGSIQGFTAWLQHPYFKPPHGLPGDYKGYPAYTQTQVTAFMSHSRDKGWQMLVHANADGAIQQMLDTLESVFVDKQAIQRGRHTVIHAQMSTEDQLDRMNELGVIPSFMAAHPFYYGDYHVSDTIGPERAARLDPLKSASDRKIPFNIHNDAPVFPPDIMRMVWASVNRLSRSGQIIGPEQRISTLQALKAVTLDGAYQYFEENEKGSLTPGKLADLVILEKNPLQADPGLLKDIKILATYKEGRLIFSR